MYIKSKMAFQTGNPEVFAASFHWSSTELDSTNAGRLQFATGFSGNSSKTAANPIRAFRKLAL